MEYVLDRISENESIHEITTRFTAWKQKHKFNTKTMLRELGHTCLSTVGQVQVCCRGICATTLPNTYHSFQIIVLKLVFVHTKVKVLITGSTPSVRKT